MISEGPCAENCDLQENKSIFYKSNIFTEVKNPMKMSFYFSSYIIFIDYF